MNNTNQINTIKILLADDDLDDRLFFQKALKGITIETELTSVKDGEELLTYLSNNPIQLPDLIFLDLSMPRKTGFECLIEIKENENLKGIPVVVFTTSFGRGNVYEQTLINSLSSYGAHDFIRKPASVDDLKQIIYKILTSLIENKMLGGQA